MTGDVTMEIATPQFRVYFWRMANQACREFEVNGADVSEVLAWAESGRQPDETYTPLVVQALGDDGVLTRIAGSEPGAADSL